MDCRGYGRGDVIFCKERGGLSRGGGGESCRVGGVVVLQGSGNENDGKYGSGGEQDRSSSKGAATEGTAMQGLFDTVPYFGIGFGGEIVQVVFHDNNLFSMLR